jgi:vancomycin resistance protein VanW
MKAYVKKIVSQAVIARSKVALGYAYHVWKGSFFKFVSLKNKSLEQGFSLQIVETQEIKQGALFENKWHNIQLTASKISNIVIPRGGIFSFWHLVGNPSQHSGFKESRMIRNGQLGFEVGGGVCQVSSLVYLAALQAGLTILERHNHSVDIYQEDERFAPLGADATVVYGNKDLKFLNNLDSDIQLIINVLENKITLTLFTKTPIQKRVLRFDRYEENARRIVKTMAERDGKWEELAVSVYKI